MSGVTFVKNVKALEERLLQLRWRMRQIVVNDGLARIELNKLKSLCKDKEKDNESIKENNTFIYVWSINLSLVEKSISKCCFTDQSINALHGELANIKAGTIGACSPIKLAPI